jgi:carboxypeptidase C (cathepsin A)
MILKEEEEESGEKPKASVFYIAYTKKDVEDIGKRPLTFSFNGGPGSSSVWLHLGVLGPRRVKMGDVDNLLPPPYQMVENEFSLLDETDLVFIDPVGTGYSRPVPGEEAKQFYSVKKDVKSVGEFIRLFTTRNKRWSSPKFLIGESYGTTRAAELSGFLQDRHGMYFNGVMLVSTVLNFQSTRFNPGNDLPYILFLPTYAATAWYHKRLEDSLQSDLRETLDEVEHFATNEYALALFKGAKLSEGEKAHIVKKLSRYTGLSEEYIEQTNLRIDIYRFVKELLRDERRTVGRLDARFKGMDRDAAGEKFEFDPSYKAIQGPFTTVLNDYVRRELAFEQDLPYEILTNLSESWDFDEFVNQYVNVAETLRKAMALNPSLKVFVANGYYDLATPYFATEYTFNHLHIDPSLEENITMTYYQAGHMMYIHHPSLVKLKKDLSDFIQSATTS